MSRRVSESQARVQMVLWSIMPTQLILGEDVTKMSDGNEELIAVSQDVPLVGPAKRIVGGDLTFPCGSAADGQPINWTAAGGPVSISSAWGFVDGAGSCPSRSAV
jgi:hypothetical protein